MWCSGVCTEKTLKTSLELPSQRVFQRYTCRQDSLYTSLWTDECAGEPDWGPQRVTSLGTDQELFCDGTWNCPYAVVRAYFTNDLCSEDSDSWWTDEAYIIESCQPLGSDESGAHNASTKLVCDESTGIVQHIYRSQDCTGDVDNAITHIEPNECTMGKDGTLRKFRGCSNRDNDTRPMPSKQPTSEPTTGGSGMEENGMWMIIGIVFIVLFVIAVVMCGLLMLWCRSKEKAPRSRGGYQQTGTAEADGTEMYAATNGSA